MQTSFGYLTSGQGYGGHVFPLVFGETGSFFTAVGPFFPRARAFQDREIQRTCIRSGASYNQSSTTCIVPPLPPLLSDAQSLSSACAAHRRHRSRHVWSGMCKRGCHTWMVGLQA